jgi:hypothetical protein
MAKPPTPRNSRIASERDSPLVLLPGIRSDPPLTLSMPVR